MLDILIYAEPAKKVFAQGAFAAVSNIITAVVVGGLLILAYTKTIAKKGSWTKSDPLLKLVCLPTNAGRHFAVPPQFPCEVPYG